jgi:hypothetical protein
MNEESDFWLDMSKAEIWPWEPLCVQTKKMHGRNWPIWSVVNTEPDHIIEPGPPPA